MLKLLQNPIFVGGIIPMICFGVFNFVYKPLSQRIPLPILLLSVMVGAIFLILSYDLATEQVIFSKKNWKMENFSGFLLGIIWAIASVALGISLSKMNGNPAQIVPLVNANTLVTILLLFMFAPNELITSKILLGVGLIFSGMLFIF